MAQESVVEFVDDLRRLRTEAGQPSLRDIARLSRQHTKRLPHSTAGDLLKSTTRPPVRSVIAFVVACREYAKELGLDLLPARTSLAGWQLRWQALPSAPAPCEKQEEAAPEAAKPLGGERVDDQGHVWLPGRGSEYLILSCSEFGELPGLPEVAHQMNELASTLPSVAPWCSVSVLHNVTAAQAIEAISQAAKRAQDVTFLHIATHAVLDEQAQLTLLMKDSDGYTRGVKAEHLVRPLRGRAPTVMILDSCYAGGITSLLDDSLDSSLALVLAAAGAREFALAGASSLTGFLARLLAHGASDLPPLLTIRTIFDRLVRNVGADLLRTDVRLGTSIGPRPMPECIRRTPFADDIVLAVNRAWVSPTSDLPATGPRRPPW